MTLHRLWLVFCQTATIALGALFVVVTLRPEWLGGRELGQVIINQIAPAAQTTGKPLSSYSEAVRKAVAQWDALELEEAIIAAKGAGGMVRTMDEWAKSSAHG